jgi:hypothetical protein
MRLTCQVCVVLSNCHVAAAIMRRIFLPVRHYQTGAEITNLCDLSHAVMQVLGMSFLISIRMEVITLRKSHSLTFLDDVHTPTCLVQQSTVLVDLAYFRYDLNEVGLDIA